MSAETKTDRVLRDVLNGDNLRDLLGEDAVNNAMKWRFLQAALYVLDGHGLLGDPDEKKDAIRSLPTQDDDGREAAPLDPSAVKAGDTVTVVQRTAAVTDEVTLVSQGPHWHFDLKVYPSTVILGVPGVDDGLWTLTDHQPAPEPEPEWKPGTVAVVIQGGDPGAGVDDHEFRAALQTDGMWVGLSGEAATSAPVSVHPLVVTDPAEVDWPALQGKISQKIPGERPFAVALEIIGIFAETVGIEAAR